MEMASGLITTSSAMSSFATEPTTLSMSIGDMPVPGPLVVSMSRDMTVPRGMSCLDTIDLDSFSKHFVSEGCFSLMKPPMACSMVLMLVMSSCSSLGSRLAAWSPPFIVRSSVTWRSTTLAPSVTAACDTASPASCPEYPITAFGKSCWYVWITFRWMSEGAAGYVDVHCSSATWLL